MRPPLGNGNSGIITGVAAGESGRMSEDHCSNIMSLSMPPKHGSPVPSLKQLKSRSDTVV